MLVYRIKHVRYHDGYVVIPDQLTDFLCEFEQMEIGDPGFIITKEEISPEKYEQLKEFQGW